MNRLLLQHPLKTNIAIGGFLGGVADIFTQYQHGSLEKMNMKRWIGFTTFSALYAGGVCFKVYSIYSRVFGALELSGFKKGLFLSLVDNFIHVPLFYTPTYFVSLSIAEGRNFEEAMTWFSSSYYNTLIACWSFWIPAHTVNFSLLPLRYQTVFMNALNFLWSIILDTVTLSDTYGLSNCYLVHLF